MSGAAAVAPSTAGVTVTTVSKHLRTSRCLGRVLLDRQPDCQAEIAQRRVIALHALTQPEDRRAGGDDRAVLARRGVLDERVHLRDEALRLELHGILVHRGAHLGTPAFHEGAAAAARSREHPAGPSLRRRVASSRAGDAGEAPRLLAYDDAVGCPLDQAIAALEWTVAVGILAADDLMHAARVGAESAAAVVERKDGDQRVFIYLGPRMDAPPADPYEGTLPYDAPGVRPYMFAQRVHAIAHFLRASLGLGAVIAMLGRRPPELRHVRRWLQAVFAEPAGETGSTRMLAGWFATGGAGVLFLPHHADDP